MYKITLINMPFSSLSLPSIALTQLKSVVEQRCGDRVRVRILYFNLEFESYFGRDLYGYIIGALQANNSGLGDWIFRQVAFPDQADNTAYYFQRYFPRLDETEGAIKGAMLAKRAGLKRYFDRLVTKHGLEGENLVGFTSMFAQNVACCALARTVKERNPKVVTVMGGANCETPMGLELARHFDPVDFVFSGPALVSFPDFVERALAGESESLHSIRGVFSRRNVDTPFVEGTGGVGVELPIEVPVPLDYDSFVADVKRSFPRGEVRPSLTFETSRGCWWGERSHCTFCGLNGSTMMYRAMPSEMAIGLFNGLFERYGNDCSRFESVDNILPRQYFKEVFPQIATPPGASIFYEVKADIKEWEMEILGRAGVTEIQPGIEALASSTLKLMGKGTTSFQNLGFLKSCLRYGIRPSWNLLIGFPREEEAVYEKYLRDVPLLVHLPPPSGAFPVRFDRYSPYYTRAAEYGLDLAPYEFYNAIYPFDAESIGNLAYYFEDRNYDAEYITKLTAWQGRLMAAVERWSQRYYGADGAPRASLDLTWVDGSAAIRDSRSGEIAEHRLSDLSLDLLKACRQNGLAPHTLAERMGVDDATVGEEIRRLSDLGLLFDENGRYISLVVGIESWKEDLSEDPTSAFVAQSDGKPVEIGGRIV